MNKREQLETMPTQEKAQNEKALVSGIWTDGTPWEFHTSTDFPDYGLCTATFGVVTLDEKLVVVEHASRGWELPGGHIEPGEDPQQALLREVLEETGVVGEVGSYFGHKKISPAQPIPKREGGGHYPFPHSYVPYNTVAVREMMATSLAPDVTQVQLVSFEDAVVLFNDSIKKHGVDHGHAAIIQYCLDQGLL